MPSFSPVLVGGIGAGGEAVVSLTMGGAAPTKAMCPSCSNRADALRQLACLDDLPALLG